MPARKRRLPRGQAVPGDPERDISAPIPIDIARASALMESGDVLTPRELEAEREWGVRGRAKSRAAVYELAAIATYEVSAGVATDAPAAVVTNLPPAELGEVLFWQGGSWRIDAIGPAQTPEADARLILSPTTDHPTAA